MSPSEGPGRFPSAELRCSCGLHWALGRFVYIPSSAFQHVARRRVAAGKQLVASIQRLKCCRWKPDSFTESQEMHFGDLSIVVTFIGAKQRAAPSCPMSYSQPGPPAAEAALGHHEDQDAELRRLHPGLHRAAASLLAAPACVSYPNAHPQRGRPWPQPSAALQLAGLLKAERTFQHKRTKLWPLSFPCISSGLGENR